MKIIIESADNSYILQSNSEASVEYSKTFSVFQNFDDMLAEVRVQMEMKR